MRGTPDSHPELHRKLAWYHAKKWIFPNSQIPLPETTTKVAPNPEPGGFLDTLSLNWIGGDRPYLVVDDYRYDSILLDRIITVEAGYKTDFASVPRLFWRIFPPHGPYVPATVVHDWLCDLAGSTGVDSATTHNIFLEAMEVLRVPVWKRAIMYRGVKWFGPQFKSASSQNG